MSLHGMVIFSEQDIVNYGNTLLTGNKGSVCLINLHTTNIHSFEKNEGPEVQVRHTVQAIRNNECHEAITKARQHA